MRELLNRFLNATDPTRDVRLAAFGLGVLASVVWLSVTLRPGMNSGWNTAYGIFMGAVSLGGAAWTAVDRIKGGAGGAQSKAKGVEDQEGRGEA